MPLFQPWAPRGVTSLAVIFGAFVAVPSATTATTSRRAAIRVAWADRRDRARRAGHLCREWTGSEHQFSLRAKEAHLHQIEAVLSDPADFEEQRDRWQASLDATAPAPGAALTPEDKARRISAPRLVAPSLRRVRAATNAALAWVQTPDGRWETRVRQIVAVRDFLELELSEWHEAHRPLGERYDRCQARLERAIIDAQVRAAALLPSNCWRYLSASACGELHSPWGEQQSIDGERAWLLVDEAEIACICGPHQASKPKESNLPVHTPQQRQQRSEEAKEKIRELVAGGHQNSRDRLYETLCARGDNYTRDEVDKARKGLFGDPRLGRPRKNRTE